MSKQIEYIDTGVNWLGKIPSTWESKRIKMLTRVKRGASPRPIDNPIYFDEEGEFAWVRISDVTASERYLESTTQRLSELGSSLSVKRYPDDFFLSIAGTVGKPIITKIKCCIHDGFVYFPDLKINPEFLYYIFSTGLPYLGLGKLGTQLNLNTDTVGDIYIPIPAEQEIEKIVSYLDERTAEIDNLISKKQKLIDFVLEEIEWTVFNCITKGVRQNRKFKKTNIEWLDEIPAEWELCRLKHLVKVKDGTHDTPANVLPDEFSYPLVTSKDINNGEIDFSEARHISAKDHNKIIQRSDVTLNDVIMPMIGTVGGAAVVRTNNPFSIKNVALFKTSKSNLNPFYLKFLLDSKLIKTQFEIVSRGGVQNFVSLDILENLLVPKNDEQDEIVNYLNTYFEKSNNTLDKIKQEIELIKEYRTSLINEVVTGKITLN